MEGTANALTGNPTQGLPARIWSIILASIAEMQRTGHRQLQAQETVIGEHRYHLGQRQDGSITVTVTPFCWKKQTLERAIEREWNSANRHSATPAPIITMNFTEEQREAHEATRIEAEQQQARELDRVSALQKQLDGLPKAFTLTLGWEDWAAPAYEVWPVDFVMIAAEPEAELPLEFGGDTTPEEDPCPNTTSPTTTDTPSPNDSPSTPSPDESTEKESNTDETSGASSDPLPSSEATEADAETSQPIETIEKTTDESQNEPITNPPTSTPEE